jgi:hypothetical protein
MQDGDTGKFITYLIWDEVTVDWTWYEGDDWDIDGYFDIYVYKDGINVTYDIPKKHLQWIEEEVKEYSGYMPPTRQRIASAINGHFNKTF